MAPSTVNDLKLEVDAEFAAVMPVVGDATDADLRSLVEEDGEFTDPVWYWKEGGRCFIVDGHRRMRLWDGFPKGSAVPPPLVRELKRKDRPAVVRWIRQRGFSRRNLTPKQQSEQRGLAVLQEENRSISAAKPTLRQNGGKSPSKKPPKMGRPATTRRKAAKVIAEAAGVSEATVLRDAEYAEALEAIGHVNGKAKRDISAGTIKLAKGDVIAIGKLDRDGIGEALLNIRKGKPWNAEKRQQTLKPTGPTNADRAMEHLRHVEQLVGSMEDEPDKLRVATALRSLANVLDPPSSANKRNFSPPSVSEVQAYCDERKNGIDAKHFVDFYASKGWMIGKSKMKDWRASVRTWEDKHKQAGSNGRSQGLNDEAFAEVFGAR